MPNDQHQPGTSVLTKYVIISSDLEDVWRVAGRIAARSAEAALRRYVNDHGAGTFIAIPERHWKPVTATTTTKTVVELNTGG